MKPLTIVRYSAWAAIAVLAAVIAAVVFAPKPQGAAYGGAFVLDSTLGKPVDRTEIAGRPYAMFFGFTNCPDVCPTTMFELSQSMKGLGDAAKDFRVYFVTVDPERDTVQTLKDYVSAFDPRIVGLVPKDQEQLADIARRFHVFYRKVPIEGGYTMDHSAAVLLFDGKGQLAGTIDTSESDATRQAKLKRLIAG